MSLSIALTKGRLEKQTVGMLEECGYGIESLKNKAYPAASYLCQLVFVKPGDVPACQYHLS